MIRSLFGGADPAPPASQASQPSDAAASSSTSSGAADAVDADATSGKVHGPARPSDSSDDPDTFAFDDFVGPGTPAPPARAPARARAMEAEPASGGARPAESLPKLPTVRAASGREEPHESVTIISDIPGGYLNDAVASAAAAFDAAARFDADVRYSPDPALAAAAAAAAGAGDGGRLKLDSATRLSFSPIWDWGRAADECYRAPAASGELVGLDNGARGWIGGADASLRAQGPHCTPLQARAWAQAALAYADATPSHRPSASDTPLTVIEFNGGAGRLAFLFLTALAEMGALSPANDEGAGAGKARPRVRYVICDREPSLLAHARSHPCLARFIASGVLDFALGDPEDFPQGLHLLESNCLLIPPGSGEEDSVAAAAVDATAAAADVLGGAGFRAFHPLSHTAAAGHSDSFAVRGLEGCLYLQGPTAFLGNSVASRLRHDAFTVTRAPLENQFPPHVVLPPVGAPLPPDFAIDVDECLAAVWTSSRRGASDGNVERAGERVGESAGARLVWERRPLLRVPVHRLQCTAAAVDSLLQDLPDSRNHDQQSLAALSAGAIAAGTVAAASFSLAATASSGGGLTYYTGVDSDVNVPLAAAAVAAAAGVWGCGDAARWRKVKPRRGLSSTAATVTSEGEADRAEHAAAWGRLFAKKRRAPHHAEEANELLLTVPIGALAMVRSARALTRGQCLMLLGDTFSSPGTEDSSTSSSSRGVCEPSIACPLQAGARAPTVSLAGAEEVQPWVGVNGSLLQSFVTGTGGACVFLPCSTPPPLANRGPAGTEGVAAIVFHDAYPSAAAAVAATAVPAPLGEQFLCQAAISADVAAAAVGSLGGAVPVSATFSVPPRTIVAAAAAHSTEAGPAAVAALESATALALVAGCPASAATTAGFADLHSTFQHSSGAVACNAGALRRLHRWGYQSLAAAVTGAVAAAGAATGVLTLPPYTPHKDASSGAAKSEEAEERVRANVSVLSAAAWDPLLLVGAMAEALVADVSTMLQAAHDAAATSALESLPGVASVTASRAGSRSGSVSGDSRAGSSAAASAVSLPASLPPRARACLAALHEGLRRCCALDFPLPSSPFDEGRVDTDAPFAAGRVLLAMRALASAVSAFSLSARRYGEHPATAHNAGVGLVLMGRPRAGAQWLGRAIELARAHDSAALVNAQGQEQVQEREGAGGKDSKRWLRIAWRRVAAAEAKDRAREAERQRQHGGEPINS